jgi:hypothetical protein
MTFQKRLLQAQHKQSQLLFAALDSLCILHNTIPHSAVPLGKHISTSMVYFHMTKGADMNENGVVQALVQHQRYKQLTTIIVFLDPVPSLPQPLPPHVLVGVDTGRFLSQIQKHTKQDYSVPICMIIRDKRLRHVGLSHTQLPVQWLYHVGGERLMEWYADKRRVSVQEPAPRRYWGAALDDSCPSPTPSGASYSTGSIQTEELDPFQESWTHFHMKATPLKPDMVHVAEVADSDFGKYLESLRDNHVPKKTKKKPIQWSERAILSRIPGANLEPNGDQLDPLVETLYKPAHEDLTAGEYTYRSLLQSLPSMARYEETQHSNTVFSESGIMYRVLSREEVRRRVVVMDKSLVVLERGTNREVMLDEIEFVLESLRFNPHTDVSHFLFVERIKHTGSKAGPTSIQSMVVDEEEPCIPLVYADSESSEEEEPLDEFEEEITARFRTPICM